VDVLPLASRKAAFPSPENSFPRFLYIALVGTVFADTVYFWAIASIPALNAVLIGHLNRFLLF